MTIGLPTGIEFPIQRPEPIVFRSPALPPEGLDWEGKIDGIH